MADVPLNLDEQLDGNIELAIEEAMTVVESEPQGQSLDTIDGEALLASLEGDPERSAPEAAAESEDSTPDAAGAADGADLTGTEIDPLDAFLQDEVIGAPETAEPDEAQAGGRANERIQQLVSERKQAESQVAQFQQQIQFLQTQNTAQLESVQAQNKMLVDQMQAIQAEQRAQLDQARLGERTEVQIFEDRLAANYEKKMEQRLQGATKPLAEELQAIKDQQVQQANADKRRAAELRITNEAQGLAEKLAAGLKLGSEAKHELAEEILVKFAAGFGNNLTETAKMVVRGRDNWAKARLGSLRGKDKEKLTAGRQEVAMKKGAAGGGPAKMPDEVRQEGLDAQFDWNIQQALRDSLGKG